ncbi:MAG: RIP metalloprotease RseP [Legionellales bacterium]|nr:RIP metalloprotease RseP [Legionellales bacterium]|tara:strand:+ start:58822 stop:60171 length:1350 start_codon:yes stop_codon:yes gene_type:complete
MTEVLWSIVAFIVAIAILITFHEYGHFIVARLLGVKVLRFSVGFGKALFKWQSKKGTEYRIALFPIGGYVKMVDEREGEVAPEDLPYAFNRKPLLTRIAVVIAGPLFNFIFAIVAYWLIFAMGFSQLVPIVGEVEANSIAARGGIQAGDVITQVAGKAVHSWQDVRFAMLPYMGTDAPITMTTRDPAGETTTHNLALDGWKVDEQQPQFIESLGLTPDLPEIPAEVQKVLPDSPAANAGMQAGDKIIRVDDTPITSWQVLTRTIDNAPEQVKVTVLRDGKQRQLTMDVAVKHEGQWKKRYIGVQSANYTMPEKYLHDVDYNVVSAWWPAVRKTWQMSALSVHMLYKMVIGDISFRAISGPIGIAQGAGYSASLGFSTFINFLAIVSIGLAIVNILPIPVLDGGHLLYYVIEALLGRPLSERAQLIGIKIGLSALILLMGLALYNDISRL